MKLLVKSFLIISLVALASCSSHKKSGSSEKAGPALTQSNVIRALAESYSGWESFYAPFTVRCSEPLSLSVSGRATMVRDKYIYLSMRMIGFEVASIYIDSDSAIVADKYHKILVAEPLEKLTVRTGLSVGDLQELLLGRAFFPGEGNLCDIAEPQSKFSVSPLQDGFIFTPRRVPAGVGWYMTIDRSPALTQINIEPEGYNEFIVNFSEIVESVAGSVACDVAIMGNVAGRNIEASVQWNLSKARWNGDVSAPSLSFKGYKRLDSADLMSTLSQF